MRALGAGFFIAFLVALALTPQVRRLALRLGALDRLSARKVPGKGQVPRLGGLAIAAAFYVALAFLWLAQSTVATFALTTDNQVVALLLGAVPILVLGCLDDLRGVRALTKLAVQFSVAAGLYHSGLRVGLPESLSLPPGVMSALSFALTGLWIAGLINAVNLIDGLDGLASGVAFFALCATSAIALGRNDMLLALFAVTLCGAVLGFLFFNWNPASIFMGDTGSMFLGYLLATTSIWSVQKAATAVIVVFPVVALGLPLLDTSLTIGRRLLSGRPVLLADRDHVHHRLLGRGLSQRQAVVLLYAVCAVFCGLSVGMVFASRPVARLLLGLSAFFAVALAWALGYVRGGPEGMWYSLRRRRRNRQMLQRLGAMQPALDRAQRPIELQELVQSFAAAMDLADLRLELGEEAPARGTSYPIRTLDGVVGRLECGTAELGISPDDRILMQLLCDLLAPQLRRLSTRRQSGRFTPLTRPAPAQEDLPGEGPQRAARERA